MGGAPRKLIEPISGVPADRLAMAALYRQLFPDKRIPITPAEFRQAASRVEADTARRFAELIGIPEANLKITPSEGTGKSGTLEIVNPKNEERLTIGRFEEMPPTSEGYCASISFEVFVGRIGSTKYSRYWQNQPRYDLSHTEDFLPRGVKRGSRAAFDAIVEDVEGPYSDDTCSPVYVFVHGSTYYPHLQD